MPSPARPVRDVCALPQAVIDIAENFLARMCNAAKVLADHRASAAAAAAAAGVTPQSTVEVRDFKLYLSQHAGLEVADFDEQRWVDTLATKLADEKKAAEAARRAQEAAAAAARAAEAKKQAELAAAAEAKKQAEQAAAAAAAAHAQHQAQIVAAAHGHAGVPAPGDQTAFNAERQRVMEAAARTGLPSPAAAQEAAFPTRFIITCTNCKTLMQAPKVPCHSPMSQPRARGARPLPSRISPG
jgi:hypothetical protein